MTPVPQTTPLPDVAGLERAELEALLEAAGVEPYRARQIFRWVFARGVTDFGQMTDLSKPLRARLPELFRISRPAIVGEERSSDGTTKLLLELDDRRRIESVFIPDSPGDTFCISTQVGCAMKCAFCLTGKMGLDAEPHGRRDRRPGARARRRASACSTPASTSS